jgi:hypothetical protein
MIKYFIALLGRQRILIIYFFHVLSMSKITIENTLNRLEMELMNSFSCNTTSITYNSSIKG